MYLHFQFSKPSSVHHLLTTKYQQGFFYKYIKHFYTFSINTFFPLLREKQQRVLLRGGLAQFGASTKPTECWLRIVLVKVTHNRKHYKTYKVKVLVAQLYLTLCNPKELDCSLPASSVHGILQERILEWVAIPFSGESFWPRGWTQISCIAGGFFVIWATREAPLNDLWWPKWEGNPKKRGYMCIYSWFTLLYSRN